MADKISGNGRSHIDVGTARTRAVAHTGDKGHAGATQRSRQSTDSVEITDTAAKLKAVEARLAQVPDVDRARVDAIRKRVESGEYQPDAARIAQKLLRMEQELK